MPSFVATPAVTWAFAGTSNSASREIPSADAVYLAVTAFPTTSLSATIAGNSPTESYSVIAGDSTAAYFGVWIGAASGSQTVVVTSADSTSASCGLRGVDDIDSDPFDGTVSDEASPGDLDIATSSDGLAVGICNAAASSVTTSDTEVFEGPDQSGVVTHCASAPGTGGTVQINWSGTIIYFAIGANLRHAAGGGSTAAHGVSKSDQQAIVQPSMAGFAA